VEIHREIGGNLKSSFSGKPARRGSVSSTTYVLKKQEMEKLREGGTNPCFEWSKNPSPKNPLKPLEVGFLVPTPLALRGLAKLGPLRTHSCLPG
jgi:hypothetical protein